MFFTESPRRRATAQWASSWIVTEAKSATTHRRVHHSAEEG